MKKFAFVFAVALSPVVLDLAKADQPGPDWMPAQQVIEQVLKSGYTQVTKLEADDGRWEGEGIKDGLSRRSEDRRNHVRRARRLSELVKSRFSRSRINPTSIGRGELCALPDRHNACYAGRCPPPSCP